MIKVTNKLLIITTAFLVLTNIIVLAGVASNRSGEPIASLKLTERELSLPYYNSSISKENSGLALKLNWNIAPPEPLGSTYSRYNLKNYGTPNWLTKQKIKELGIDIENKVADLKKQSSRYQKLASKDVIIVLEHNGEAFQKIINKAEKDIQHYRNSAKVNKDDEALQKKLKRHEDSLTKLKTTESRLIAIDAGRSLETLKQKYTDSSKYLMLRGEIKLTWSNKKLKARIKQLFVSSVHVPLPYSKALSEMASDRKKGGGEKVEYEVELVVGKRLEFWVGGVALL